MTSETFRKTAMAMTMVLGSLTFVAGQQRLTPVSGDTAGAEVRTFEGILRAAVERGLDNLIATRGADGDVRFLGHVTSESFDPPGPGAGLVFVVRVPDLAETSSIAISLRPVPVSPPPPSGARPNVSSLVAASVRDALLDAVVHGSGTLTVDRDAWLTIVACAAQGTMQQPAGLRKLYVMVRGSDLTTIQRQRLSDQEARRLVVVAER